MIKLLIFLNYFAALIHQNELEVSITDLHVGYFGWLGYFY